MNLNFVQEIINQLRLHLNKDLILQHFNKFIQLQYYKNHIKTLVLGSSHGDFGYIAKEDEFNLSLTSQDLYYSYKLYEKYANLSQLKNIILFYSVFSNGFILDKTSLKEIALSYKMFFDIPIVHNCLYLKLRNLSFPKYLCKVIKTEIIFCNGNNKHTENLFMNTKEITANERAKAHKKTYNRPDKQIKWLKLLIQLANKNKHRVFIVISPATKEYKSYLVSESNLFTEIKELKHCKIIDLYNSNLFEQEDFGDWDHLNENGAKKLSNYVRNLIEVDHE